MYAIHKNAPVNKFYLGCVFIVTDKFFFYYIAQIIGKENLGYASTIRSPMVINVPCFGYIV